MLCFDELPFALQQRWRNRTIASILLGTWLLTAWDLVLDPSMAAPQLQYVHFWIWHESGPYFGMPLRNLVGWLATGLAFIAVGRAGGRAPTTRGRWRRGCPSASMPSTVSGRWL